MKHRSMEWKIKSNITLTKTGYQIKHKSVSSKIKATLNNGHNDNIVKGMCRPIRVTDHNIQQQSNIQHLPLVGHFYLHIYHIPLYLLGHLVAFSFLVYY